MRPRSRGAAVAALALLLAGCTGSGTGSGAAADETSQDPAVSTRVDLDTPALRAVRRQAGLAPCEDGPGEPGAAGDDGLPSVELPCFGAPGSVDLATLRGPMVVSLWASWCPPCRRELPIFQQFSERRDDVAVLGIDYADQQTSNAGELLLESGVTYPQLGDPGGELSGAAPLPRIAGLPFLALVDEEGRVVHQEFRELDDVADLEGLVREHLAAGARPGEGS